MSRLWKVCEQCDFRYLAADEDQKYCCAGCMYKHYEGLGVKLRRGLIINRLCRICNKPFRAQNRRHDACSKQCAKDNFWRQLFHYDPGEYDQKEIWEPMACTKCKHWVVNEESENGGYCKIGRWRACKPYMPGAKPYEPKEE